METVVPAFATVRPRALSRDGANAELLTDAVEEYVEDHPTGVLWITGDDGAGKSMALAHLAAHFDDGDRFLFLDNVQYERIANETPKVLIVAAGSRMLPAAAAKLRLASWGEDELIEYLLSAHRDQCRSVMLRLRTSKSLLRTPEVARVILDRHAADPDLCNAQQAVVTHVSECLGSDESVAEARRLCLAAQRGDNRVRISLTRSGAQQLPADILRLLRHEIVQLPFAAEQVAEELVGRTTPAFLRQPLSTQLIEAAAQPVRGRSGAFRRLRKILRSDGEAASHPMAASICLAADPAWRPEGANRIGRFAAGYFRKADWRDLELSEADLGGADLSGANLERAVLDHANLIGADLSGATLSSASMNRASANRAVFLRADLKRAALVRARLNGACFEEADLSDAVLSRADLCEVNFNGACMACAVLRGAHLVAADLDGADFHDAVLTEIDARRVDFRKVELRGALANRAILSGANFEDLTWEDADLSGADLRSALMSGSRIPHGDLHGANLSGSRLGEIEWEDVDLRDANLRGATFHYGSSRSGLVDSYIASEGTRTGFYTDGLEELYYKDPEQVRTANLRRADLRGADIANVDFYLVDLRDAKLDAEQRRHARLTGAILSDR
ncbi:pentapeptide repeat-containing protein [Pirellulales bacterium]|nr:pentapeptide repeat-containing protein [Pirellulales bacterium]